MLFNLKNYHVLKDIYYLKTNRKILPSILSQDRRKTSMYYDVFNVIIKNNIWTLNVLTLTDARHTRREGKRTIYVASR